MTYEIKAEDPNNYWNQQLKRESLKEPELKMKYFWLKPLTTFHRLEFRGRLHLKKELILEMSTNPKNMMHGNIKSGIFHQRREFYVRIIWLIMLSVQDIFKADFLF